MALILWDVNIWVYAFRPDSPYHHRSRNVLEDSLHQAEAFMFSPGLATSFLRLVTNSRIFKEPSSLDEALDFVEALEYHPAARFTDADPMTWGIFKHLALSTKARGNTIPDIFLAAQAIRHDAVLRSFDQGFESCRSLQLDLLKP